MWTSIFLAFIGLIFGAHGQVRNSSPKPDNLWLSASNGVVPKDKFSCTGGTGYCPDPSHSLAGGNLTVSIIAMKDLPDLDSFGASGGETDAFIRVTIGERTQESDPVPNSLNPYWPPCSDRYCQGDDDLNRELHMGVQISGTPMTIEVLDKDSGLEFGDDELGTITTYVIFCSMFTAPVQRTPHGGDDSYWQMETQPVCEEEAWLPLEPGVKCLNKDGSITDHGACVKIRMTVVPFQMRIEDVYAPYNVSVGVAGTYSDNYDVCDDCTARYGRPYSDSFSTRLDANFFMFHKASGGLMLRPSIDSKDYFGDKAAVPWQKYAKYSINFDAALFVFRMDDDYYDRPEWLMGENGWKGYPDVKVTARFIGSERNMLAYSKNVSGIVVNKYGDAEGRGHLTGINIAVNQLETDTMYFLVARMHTADVNWRAGYSKYFDRWAFTAAIVEFGVPYTAFLALVAIFMQKVNFRLDRVESYLASQTIDGSRRNIVAGLFLGYNDSVLNIEFRRNLFYGKCCITLVMALPFIIFWTWGLCMIATVHPPAVGFALLFVGTAAKLVVIASFCWRRGGWRLTKNILGAFAASLILGFVFLLASTFVDPRVYEGGEDIDFFSVTAVFLTLNMMPVVWLAFSNDQKMKKSFQQLTTAASAQQKISKVKNKFSKLGALGLKLGAAKKEDKQQPSIMQRDKSSLDSLLGEYYTIVKTIPGFELGDILESFLTSSAEKREKVNRVLTRAAIGVLALYVFICFIGGDSGFVALANSLTVLLLDFSIILLKRENNLQWSPGYVVLLLGLCRVCLVATTGIHWLFGRCFAFIVMGLALCREIVDKRLPMISGSDASGVTFFGMPIPDRRYNDLSSTPEFVLGFLSFFFLASLLTSTFSLPEGEPQPTIPVFGQSWPVSILSVISFLLVMIAGLGLATSRAFYLLKQRLQSKRANEIYLFFKQMKLPYMVAGASELLLVSSGMLIYGATSSVMSIVIAIFAPAIILVAVNVVTEWVSHDFRLVVWPPEEEEFEEEDGEEPSEADIHKAITEGYVPPALAKSSNGDRTAAEAKLMLAASKSLAGANAYDNLPPEEREKRIEQDIRKAEEAAVHEEAQLRKEQEEREAAVAPKSKKQKVKGGLSSMYKSLRKGKSMLRRSIKVGVLKTEEEAQPNTTSLDTADEIDFASMSVVTAFREGYLLREDYMNLASFAGLLVLIFAFGVTVSLVMTPSSVGHAIWIVSFILIFSLAPIIKWANISEITPDMKLCMGCSGVLMFFASLISFTAVLGADVNNEWSLFFLCIIFYYPAFLFGLSLVYKWHDNGYHVTEELRKGVRIVLGFWVLFLFQVYVWVDVIFGATLTISSFYIALVMFFLKQWADNSNYLAPRYQKLGHRILLGSALCSAALGFLIDSALIYCASMTAFFISIKFVLKIIGAQISRPPDTPLYFSPFLFPVYSYEPETNRLRKENNQLRAIFSFFASLFLSGCFATMFVDPLGFGIGLSSLSILALTGIAAHLCTVTPIKMGMANKYIDSASLKESAKLAIDAFQQRRLPLKIKCDEWIQKDLLEKQRELELQRMTYGHGKVDTSSKVGEDEDEIVIRACAADIAIRIDKYAKDCRFEDVADKDRAKWKRRKDALFDFQDAVDDCLVTGTGPFGVVGTAWKASLRLWGKAERKYTMWKNSRHKVKPSVNSSDTRPTEDLPAAKAASLAAGSSMKEISLKDEKSANIQLVDSRRLLSLLPALDQKLDHEFHDEVQCVIHLQLLVLNAVEANLRREKILFQRFLREYNFQLLSNGLAPPKDVFRTSSHASINVSLVAIWLLSLQPEQRKKFHELKKAFNEEQAMRDSMVDARDAQAEEYAQEILEYRRRREEVMYRRRYQDFHARRERRKAEGLEIGGRDEALVNAEEALAEIESGWSCLPGEFGRTMQFHDPDFPSDVSSLGECTNGAEVVGWKVSTAININASLFSQGTDPDDVYQGKLNDSYLLSALSIVAASGGIDDEAIDPLIDQMFITKQTSLTGAYAVRFYKNSQWETVIVDDVFPVLDDSHRLEPNAGAAFAYSKNFEELWVPVIEKSYAKYHGSYAAIEDGCVHLALADLTGCHAEEIFLAKASRGSHKKQLWSQMLRYKHNNFLMGAGCIDAANADVSIQDVGLVFGATYVIYDVVAVDGLQLIRLRNPPGDHGEWSGDWSDLSPLWTRRLKKKLNWTDEDDNTFWMSFDDFCNAFRTLFVGHYYDPLRWKAQMLFGEWNHETAEGLPSKHNQGCYVSCNPQYAIVPERPLEICVTVIQVEPDGLAAQNLHPFAAFIVETSRHGTPQRVKELTPINVVGWSGPPKRERELQFACHLEPRGYTLLIAPYLKNMKGCFRVQIRTNFSCQFSQIWPPLGGGAVQKHHQYIEKVKNMKLYKAVARKIAQKKLILAESVAARAAEMKAALKDEEFKIREEHKSIQEQEKREDTVNATPWLRRWDPDSSMYYFYNPDTGISQWEEPEAYKDDF